MSEIFCTECGTKLSNQSAFCKQCGTRVAEQPIPPTAVPPAPVPPPVQMQHQQTIPTPTPMQPQQAVPTSKVKKKKSGIGIGIGVVCLSAVAGGLYFFADDLFDTNSASAPEVHDELSEIDNSNAPITGFDIDEEMADATAPDFVVKTNFKTKPSITDFSNGLKFETPHGLYLYFDGNAIVDSNIYEIRESNLSNRKLNVYTNGNFSLDTESTAKTSMITIDTNTKLYIPNYQGYWLSVLNYGTDSIFYFTDDANDSFVNSADGKIQTAANTSIFTDYTKTTDLVGADEFYEMYAKEIYESNHGYLDYYDFAMGDIPPEGTTAYYQEAITQYAGILSYTSILEYATANDINPIDSYDEDSYLQITKPGFYYLFLPDGSVIDEPSDEVFGTFHMIQVLPNQSFAEYSTQAFYNAHITQKVTFEMLAQAETETTNVEMEYILPYSHAAYLTVAELKALTTDELRIARNEIYARHGYAFTSEDLQMYFNRTSWYVNTNAIVTQDDLNDYEIENIELIKAEEAIRS